LAWTVEFSATALKDLRALDRLAARRIATFLDERVAASTNPRATGKALTGALKGLWRYRVGEYRLICDVQDHRIVVLVLRIGHRRQIYR
jgi:mRNA interferase RelE/StbE